MPPMCIVPDTGNIEASAFPAPEEDVLTHVTEQARVLGAQRWNHRNSILD